MSTPPKFKPSEIVAALHASKGMVYVAARQLDCSANTIYNYAKRHPQVQAAMTHERGMMIDVAEIALWKAIQNGEGWAISLALKTIGRERGYTEKILIEGTLQIELVNQLVQAAEEAGIDASELFNTMIQRLHSQTSKVSQDT